MVWYGKIPCKQLPKYPQNKNMNPDLCHSNSIIPTGQHNFLSNSCCEIYRLYNLALTSPLLLWKPPPESQSFLFAIQTPQEHLSMEEMAMMHDSNNLFKNLLDMKMLLTDWLSNFSNARAGLESGLVAVSNSTRIPKATQKGVSIFSLMGLSDGSNCRIRSDYRGLCGRHGTSDWLDCMMGTGKAAWLVLYIWATEIIS